MDQRTSSSLQPVCSRHRTVQSGSDRQQGHSDSVHRKMSPVSSYVPPPDYLQGDEDDDIIKPKKLINPVKESRNHQELHRELLSSYKRGGASVEQKPELQRVLASRRRDQLIKLRKEEEEARRKVTPLEQVLLKRHKHLDELDKQQQDEDDLKPPEFIKVKENLRRTSIHSKEEKEV
ncbi:LOW QUALITY PROTEIN: actin-associated protein FAM107A-like [Thalassophryne amazonica]|uniref:LOW QUALITY PROTEIN: actin-associated protein FAM107A-like n=1 Tax=Thalassophryne amazonica TaxID=390379 RepID=UPI001470B735|nr:LOW QUALITY PROTEIN: actin-associated protein FAM107A-like [Thalassophryne amazonica]